MEITFTPQILLPAAILIVWSIFVLFWMFAAVTPAAKKAGFPLDQLPPGGRTGDLHDKLDQKAVWKNHNWSHLMEQPTIFYPAAIMFSLVGPTSLDIGLVWSYVILRICHSIWQTTVNIVFIRGIIFLISTLALLALCIRLILKLI